MYPFNILFPDLEVSTSCVAAKLLGRKYIGIDESLDAVEISNERLSNPIKTESNLLKNGRYSYINSDQDALSLLSGLAFNPVQRNKGIDAILVEQFEGAPVLIRVQRKTETLSEAAAHLLQAKKAKQVKMVILIQTQENDLFDSFEPQEGMIIILSPSIQIERFMKRALTKNCTGQSKAAPFCSASLPLR